MAQYKMHTCFIVFVLHIISNVFRSNDKKKYHAKTILKADVMFLRRTNEYCQEMVSCICFKQAINDLCKKKINFIRSYSFQISYQLYGLKNSIFQYVYKSKRQDHHYINLELLRIENIFMSRKIENKTILSMTKKGLFSLRHKIDYHPRRERFSAKTD